MRDGSTNATFLSQQGLVECKYINLTGSSSNEAIGATSANASLNALGVLDCQKITVNGGSGVEPVGTPSAPLVQVGLGGSISARGIAIYDTGF